MPHPQCRMFQSCRGSSQSIPHGQCTRSRSNYLPVGQPACQSPLLCTYVGGDGSKNKSHARTHKKKAMGNDLTLAELRAGNRAHRFITAHPCPAHTHPRAPVRAPGSGKAEGSMLSCHSISLRLGSLPCDGCPTEASVCSAVGPDPVRHEVRRSRWAGDGRAQALNCPPRKSHCFPQVRARRASNLAWRCRAPIHGIAIPLLVCVWMFYFVFTRCLEKTSV